jgi:hypothetical protein
MANLCGAISNGRLHHDSVALANGHISSAHVIREAFGVQVDRQILVWKTGRRVPAFDMPIGLLIMVACAPNNSNCSVLRHPDGMSSAAEHGTPSARLRL